MRPRIVASAEPVAGPPAPEGQGAPVSTVSRRGLDAFAFFVANLQTGFGPFLAVYFSQAKWTQSDIGFALTVGSLVGLLGQVPGGAFVDAARSKRFAAGLRSSPWRAAPWRSPSGRASSSCSSPWPCTRRRVAS